MGRSCQRTYVEASGVCGRWILDLTDVAETATDIGMIHQILGLDANLPSMAAARFAAALLIVLATLTAQNASTGQSR
jgi:hypothetical protein